MDWSFSVHLEDPVEGIPLRASWFLRATGSFGTTAKTPKPTLSFSWHASIKKTVCANPDCPNISGPCDTPPKAKIEWMQHSDFSVPAKNSVFCSNECLKASFEKHRKFAKKVPGQRSTPTAKQDSTWKMFPKQNEKAEKWNHLSFGETIIPTTDNVGHELKLRVQSNDGTIDRSIITPPVRQFPAPPAQRELIYAPMSQTLLARRSRPFRVVSYNILSDIYATSAMYPYCPSWALDWKFRSRNLVREIQSYNGDIVCLQEAQQDHYEDDLVPALADEYEGHFKVKSRNTSVPGKVDGCAVFIRRSRFRVDRISYLSFNDFAPNTVQQSLGIYNDLDKAALSKRLKRDNVAMILTVRDLQTEERFLLCNTHLYWDPECPDVKVWQTQILLERLNEKFDRLPIILCGDFNSESTSAVHELITTKRIQAVHCDLDKDLYMLIDPSRVSHNFDMKSAMSTLKGSDPDFTNYTGHFTGCLDYVFFSADSVQCYSGLDIPSKEVLSHKSNTAMPNPIYSSDHTSLVADFVLGPPVVPTNQPAPPTFGMHQHMQLPGAASPLRPHQRRPRRNKRL
eukprot:TRINITY_DN4331_c0_g1_i1.p1 TRINITY_DN4331_c0_g1~~TRINITY_DN4331_c0_g1_i1.p1  ORF type:complete len:568 (-),score=126.53 TRINITY_DN4331_c0_g1_i1:522-2225(-)